MATLVPLEGDEQAQQRAEQEIDARYAAQAANAKFTDLRAEMEASRKRTYSPPLEGWEKDANGEIKFSPAQTLVARDWWKKLFPDEYATAKFIHRLYYVREKMKDKEAFDAELRKAETPKDILTKYEPQRDGVQKERIRERPRRKPEVKAERAKANPKKGSEAEIVQSELEELRSKTNIQPLVHQVLELAADMNVERMEALKGRLDKTQREALQEYRSSPDTEQRLADLYANPPLISDLQRKQFVKQMGDKKKDKLSPNLLLVLNGMLFLSGDEALKGKALDLYVIASSALDVATKAPDSAQLAAAKAAQDWVELADKAPVLAFDVPPDHPELYKLMQEEFVKNPSLFGAVFQALAPRLEPGMPMVVPDPQSPSKPQLPAMQGTPSPPVEVGPGDFDSDVEVQTVVTGSDGDMHSLAPSMDSAGAHPNGQTVSAVENARLTQLQANNEAMIARAKAADAATATAMANYDALQAEDVRKATSDQKLIKMIWVLHTLAPNPLPYTNRAFFMAAQVIKYMVRKIIADFASSDDARGHYFPVMGMGKVPEAFLQRWQQAGGADADAVFAVFMRIIHLLNENALEDDPAKVIAQVHIDTGDTSIANLRKLRDLLIPEQKLPVNAAEWLGVFMEGDNATPPRSDDTAESTMSWRLGFCKGKTFVSKGKLTGPTQVNLMLAFEVLPRGAEYDRFRYALAVAAASKVPRDGSKRFVKLVKEVYTAGDDTKFSSESGEFMAAELRFLSLSGAMIDWGEMEAKCSADLAALWDVTKVDLQTIREAALVAYAKKVENESTAVGADVYCELGEMYNEVTGGNLPPKRVQLVIPPAAVPIGGNSRFPVRTVGVPGTPVEFGSLAAKAAASLGVGVSMSSPLGAFASAVAGIPTAVASAATAAASRATATLVGGTGAPPLPPSRDPLFRQIPEAELLGRITPADGLSKADIYGAARICRLILPVDLSVLRYAQQSPFDQRTHRSLHRAMILQGKLYAEFYQNEVTTALWRATGSSTLRSEWMLGYARVADVALSGVSLSESIPDISATYAAVVAWLALHIVAV